MANPTNKNIPHGRSGVNMRAQGAGKPRGVRAKSASQSPDTAVLMSGGVDSAVAALLLKQQGVACAGVHLRLAGMGARLRLAGGGVGANPLSGGVGANPLSGGVGSNPPGGGVGANPPGGGMGSNPPGGGVGSNPPGSYVGEGVPDEADDARAVAAWLGMPFYVLDFRKEFEAEVIDRFVSAYLQGDTPNPCIGCNSRVKFGGFLRRAAAMGMDRVATGHYARVSHGEAGGRHLLRKGRDEAKDQSYMLFALTQEQLSCALFPLGNLTKRDTRELAEAHALANARKMDSQDICFVPDGDYGSFIEKRNALAEAAECGLHGNLGCAMPGDLGCTRPGTLGCARPGPLLDAQGRTVGLHNGAVRYTIGQRRGLGVALGYPAYVISKSIGDNRIVVGGEKDLYAKTLYASGVNLIAADRLPDAARVEAKSRYRQRAQPATAWQTGADELRVVFDEPQRALTTGQAVVLYDGDVVVGGGAISRVE